MTSEASESGGPLCLLLECPKCGGPFEVDDTVVCKVCPNCGSLLRLHAQREEMYLAAGRTRGPEDILEIVILYKVQSQRAEIVSRYRDAEGNPPPEAFVESRLRDFEQRLRAHARVVEARCLHVPYWHLTGTIVQGALGREHDGPKRVRIRGFGVEHTLPAYDLTRSNLRDRGLRLCRARIRPLQVRDVRKWGAFLGFRSTSDAHLREIEKWRGRNLDPEFDPILKQGDFVCGRRFLVYRPYWLARVITATEQEWVLIDGSFATIGGYPDELEARGLLGNALADPLASAEPSTRRVHVLASRCPDCGFEQSFGGFDRIVVCPNCHLGLAPEAAGIRIVPYCHAAGGDAEYLPFWRYRFALRGAGPREVTTLEEHSAALFGPRLPPAFGGPYLFLPAFKLLETDIGDGVFKDLLEWIHAARLDVRPEKIPVACRLRAWPVTLPEEDARELARFALFGLHGTGTAARLNGAIVRREIMGVSIALTDPTLVFIPSVRNGAVVSPGGDGPSIPSLLLTGGPELEAQRATVHARGMDA